MFLGCLWSWFVNWFVTKVTNHSPSLLFLLHGLWIRKREHQLSLTQSWKLLWTGQMHLSYKPLSLKINMSQYEEQDESQQRKTIPEDGRIRESRGFQKQRHDCQRVQHPRQSGMKLFDVGYFCFSNWYWFLLVLQILSMYVIFFKWDGIKWWVNNRFKQAKLQSANLQFNKISVLLKTFFLIIPIHFTKQFSLEMLVKCSKSVIRLHI